MPRALEEIMERTVGSPSARALGVVSSVLAVLGLAFYWWVPLGMVFSLSGLTAAFIGWVSRRRRLAGASALLAVGTVLALIALGVDFGAVWLGLDRVRFTELR
jgi:hypothetical protein